MSPILIVRKQQQGFAARTPRTASFEKLLAKGTQTRTVAKHIHDPPQRHSITCEPNRIDESLSTDNRLKLVNNTTTQFPFLPTASQHKQLLSPNATSPSAICYHGDLLLTTETYKVAIGAKLT